MPQGVNVLLQEMPAHCSVIANNAITQWGSRPERANPPSRRKRNNSQTDLPNSKKFAKDRGELLSLSCWSDLETVVIHEIYIQKGKILRS